MDLNLLVAFEALLHERNVSRAGARVGLAQPSMSSALGRLRSLFGDPLFIRTASGMKPTAKALALAPAIGGALDQLRAALTGDLAFDPLTARHRFSLASTDYGGLVVIPRIVAALRRDAPQVDLLVRPITDRAEALGRLEHGDVDALIGGHLPGSPRTVRHLLFKERFVCIRDARASAAGTFGREEFLSAPHAWFSSSGGDDSPSGIDDHLSRLGLSRRVALVLPHVMTVPFAIAGTDLIATLSEQVARRFVRDADLVVSEIPFDIPPYPVDLLSLRAREDGSAHSWLLALIKSGSDAGGCGIVATTA